MRSGEGGLGRPESGVVLAVGANDLWLCGDLFCGESLVDVAGDEGGEVVGYCGAAAAREAAATRCASGKWYRPILSRPTTSAASNPAVAASWTTDCEY